jgi:hypothetical protein
MNIQEMVLLTHDSYKALLNLYAAYHCFEDKWIDMGEFFSKAARA